MDINDMFLYEKNDFIKCFDVYLLVNEFYIFVNKVVVKFLFDKYLNCVLCKYYMFLFEKIFLKWKKFYEENFDKILFWL